MLLRGEWVKHVKEAVEENNPLGMLDNQLPGDSNVHMTFLSPTWGSLNLDKSVT